MGDIRHTHLHLSLPSLQTQKDVGPSYNLGPFRENEGSNKDGHSPVAHSFKEISDMYSKVYVRQKHAKSKAPISRARGRGLKSTIECNTTMLEEAQQQWNLGKVLGLEADTDQSDYIHSFANMEFRDRKEAMELGNRKICK